MIRRINVTAGICTSSLRQFVALTILNVCVRMYAEFIELAFAFNLKSKKKWRNKMKKLIFAVALGFVMTMPIAGNSLADPNYRVNVDESRIWQNAYEQGNVVCTVERGYYVTRQRENWSRWIYVQGKDAHCKGWIDKTHFVAADRFSFPTIDDVARFKNSIFTTGRWGDEVPVFRTQEAFFSARKSMDSSGHYNGQADKIDCKLSVGTKVLFKPYRDWGVGSVETTNCSGWIERAVIR